MSDIVSARAGGSTGPPIAVEIRDALSQLLASREFSKARRLSDFLRYVVETTLEGHGSRLKGYTIAVEALGRPDHFDPQLDPIVRVEAMRLRRALERYYVSEGRRQAIVIELKRGSYVPSLRRASSSSGMRLWTGLGAASRRLLAAVGRGLLPPPLTPPWTFDGREIQPVQQAQGAPAARARRPWRD